MCFSYYKCQPWSGCEDMDIAEADFLYLECEEAQETRIMCAVPNKIAVLREVRQGTCSSCRDRWIINTPKRYGYYTLLRLLKEEE